MKRKPLAAGKRFNILKRDNYTCRYCGRKPPEVKLHIDHIKPIICGGTDDDDNLVTSCAECNTGKATFNPGPPNPEELALIVKANEVFSVENADEVNFMQWTDNIVAALNTAQLGTEPIRRLITLQGKAENDCRFAPSGDELKAIDILMSLSNIEVKISEARHLLESLPEEWSDYYARRLGSFNSQY